jgi:hypothetical protein
VKGKRTIQREKNEDMDTSPVKSQKEERWTKAGSSEETSIEETNIEQGAEGKRDSREDVTQNPKRRKKTSTDK